MINSNSQLIEQTKGYCNTCQTYHESQIYAKDGQVYASLNCPTNPQQYHISSNADIYLNFRERSFLKFDEFKNYRPEPLINLMDITDGCNLKCNICIASAKTASQANFIKVEDAIKRAELLKKCKGRLVSLIGGEPTIHPQIKEIIQGITRLGLRCKIVTNGVLLGKDIAFAQELKNAGLYKASIQLDSLQPETLKAMRGVTHVHLLKAALDNCQKVGIRLSTITTITPYNIHELDEIIHFALSYTPTLTSIVLQGSTTEGRYDVDNKKVYDREQLISQILSIVPSLGRYSHKDMFPIPYYKPWGLGLHPDCAVNMPLLIKKGQIDQALSKKIDIDKVYQTLTSYQGKSNFVGRWIFPLMQILKHRKGLTIKELASSLIGTVFGKGSTGIVIVGIGSYCGTSFQDIKKIAMCPARQMLDRGLISPCVYNFRSHLWASRKGQRNLGTM